MKQALYAGTFDILTKGHLDIIKRGANLFDHLYIGLFNNIEKKSFFTPDERQAIIAELTVDLPNVTIIQSSGELAVDVAKKMKVNFLLRGLRNSDDFQYEREMARFNHELSPELETVYLQSLSQYEHISSSRMKELIYFGAPIDDYVPKLVIEKLEAKRLEKK